MRLLVIALVCVFVAGCGSSVSVDPGRTTIARTDSATYAPDGSVKRETRVEGVAVGPRGSASGEKIDQTFEGKPADLNLVGLGRASGGGVLSATEAASGLGSPLVWAGVLCILGAGVCVYLGLRAAGVVCAATGGILLLIGIYPAVLLWAVAVLAVGLVGYIVWSNRNGRSSYEALRAVVAGVESIDPTIGGIVKKAIGEQAEPADKAAIAAVKLKDNL